MSQSKMKYYEGHEGVYQKLAEAGADCWGRDDFENVYMLPYLKSALARTTLDEKEAVRALVVGCGTGPLACALSRRGYHVCGFDISSTAIVLARAQAEKRGLDIEYWVGDLCADDLGASCYDLIVDSHCMHCIVPDEDRGKALKSICRALSPDGVFIIETMMRDPSIKGGVDVDEDGIHWTVFSGKERPDYERARLRDGVWCVPQRRLRPNKEALDEELSRYGFQIRWSIEAESDEEGESGDYQAICTRRAP